jgi:hypothetical protein
MHKIARIVDFEIDLLLRIKDNDNPAGSFHDAIDCFKTTSRTQLLTLLETIIPPTEMFGQIIDECMIVIGNLAARRLGTDVLSHFVITTTAKSPVNPQARLLSIVATKQFAFANIVFVANTSLFVNNKVGGPPAPGERPPRIPPFPPYRPPRIPPPQIPPPLRVRVSGIHPQIPPIFPREVEQDILNSSTIAETNQIMDRFRVLDIVFSLSNSFYYSFLCHSFSTPEEQSC